MIGASHDSELILGGEPRVSLLPPEVAAEARGRTLRRGLVLATGGVMVIVAVGVVAAVWNSAQSIVRLADAQSVSAELLSEQQTYISVREVQGHVDLARAAREVGSATEIDWKAYLLDVRSLLPADVTIDGVDISSSSPLELYPQATSPLQPSRVATLDLTLSSPGLPAVPEWLDALATLPGFADASPGSIALGENGSYKVGVKLHVNEKAYSGRFSSVTDDGTTAVDTPTDGTE